MNFEQYAESQRKKAFGPAKKYTMRSAEEVPIPHEPGSLSQQGLAERAATNESRGSNGGSTGEVVGEDLASGESLVRTPGNRLVRVSTGEPATPGQQVSVRSSGKTDDYARIRREGSVVSKTLTSSTGWARADNAVNDFRGTASASFGITREVKDAGLLSDDCTPPDVRIRILEDAINNGVYLNERGDIVGTAASGSLRGWGDQLAGFSALGQAYKDAKKADKQKQSLPSFLSLDELGGRPRLEQQFQPGVPLFWKCVNGTCVQAEDGVYPTKALCQDQCSLTSYSCVNGTCVEVPGLTGQFKTQEECLTSGCSTRYTCISGECIPTRDGEFATLESCQASGCYWGFNCTGGTCEPAIGGTFRTLACCEQNCVPLGPGVAYFSSTRRFDVGQTFNTTTFDGVTGAPPPTGPLTNQRAYTKFKKSFDPNLPIGMSWTGTSNSQQPVLLMLNERKNHTITAISFTVDRPTDAAPTDIEEYLWVNRYLPGLPDSGAAIQTTTLLNNDRGSSVQSNIGYDAQTQQFISRRTFMDQRALYANAVTTLDAQIAASSQSDSLMIPYSGISFGESVYAEVGWRLRAQNNTTATVTDLGNGLWRYSWANVTFSSNAAQAGSEVLQATAAQQRSANWESANDDFCQNALFTRTVTGLSAQRFEFNPFLKFPSPFWPEDWSAYSLSLITGGDAVTLSVSISTAGDPVNTQDFFTGYTHPSTVSTFYPWSNERNTPAWVEPKFADSSTTSAVVTNC